LQFIEGLQNILVLEDGKQKMLGSYDHVKEMGLDAKAIIEEFNKA